MRPEKVPPAGPQWVKVEFYGRVPDGQVVTEVNPLEVAEMVKAVFGFTHIDGLVITAAEYPRET